MCCLLVLYPVQFSNLYTADASQSRMICMMCTSPAVKTRGCLLPLPHCPTPALTGPSTPPHRFCPSKPPNGFLPLPLTAVCIPPSSPDLHYIHHVNHLCGLLQSHCRSFALGPAVINNNPSLSVSATSLLHHHPASSSSVQCPRFPPLALLDLLLFLLFSSLDLSLLRSS